MATSFFHRVFGPKNGQIFARLRGYSSTVHESIQNIQQSDNSTLYPPIKPKFPAGTWGNMTSAYAWQWHELREKIAVLTDIQERQKALLARETLAMIKEPRREHRIHNFEDRVREIIDEAATVLKLDTVNSHPSVLQFRKYATKTHIFQWEQEKPKAFDNLDVAIVDKVLKCLKNSILDQLRMEYDIIERESMSQTLQKIYLCKSLIRCISECLILELGKHCNHLKTCHYDEDVIVRALWSRHGLERRKRIFTYDPDDAKFETVNDHPIISESVFDAMIRNHLPLPKFVPSFGEEMSHLESLKFSFQPSAFGEGKPGSFLLKSISAGHKFGDPCEFGLIGILSTCNFHELVKNYGPKVAQDCKLAMSLTNTFTWLAAQACNQGFSHIIDIDYPMTSQTIMTDGEKFTFMAYQLNTLELWKDELANKRHNLCWYTQEMPLYHSIEQGSVREINEDVLALLVKMFMIAPELRTRARKPSLTEKLDSLHLKCDFIPEKVITDEVVHEETYIVH